MGPPAPGSLLVIVPAYNEEAAIAEFAKSAGGDRTRRITLAFAGLLDETNRQRTDIIQRIKQLAQRQRNLADLVARLTTELDARPAEPAQDTARAELADRLNFNTRTYSEVQQTMRYACEIPAQLDARLGAYARALQAELS